MISLTSLKKLSDDELTQTLSRAVQSETKASLFVLHVLAEFEARRLYSKNASSLHHYCTKVLKFSGGAAQRRIDSMRAMKLIPEVEEKLHTGELNLTSVSQAQSLFRHEAKLGKSYSIEQKKEVLQKLENKSTRECEREIAIISPSAIPQEKRRILAANSEGQCKTEMKVVLDQSLIEKLDKIKALLSHKKPHMTDRELLEEMANLTLSKIDPAQKPLRRSSHALQSLERSSKGPQNSGRSSYALQTLEQSSQTPQTLETEQKTNGGIYKAPIFSKPRPAPVVASRYISKRVKKLVWIRDGGKCTHPGCSATHFLHFDHIVPYSLGGKSNVENIRLLCRAHNQRAAIDHFGIQKMGRYFRNRDGALF